VSRPLKIWLEQKGALLRLRLNRPKANIIDAEMIGVLTNALKDHRNDRSIVAVMLDAEGPHFSFGASVEEHMPDQCAEMLKSLHELIGLMVLYPVPILVAIRGQCLGGGLEVATAGQFLFASSDANLGQPEMTLGVFAPAASCLLPERIGQSKADDLLFSGRSVSGEEAFRIGLVDGISEDPESTALDYFTNNLAPKSASSLRFAVKAARHDYCTRVLAKLKEVENLYLESLMSTRDAVEGLEAFTAKRPAKWENR
jgi:cyclohexa-1,5-dienecarbonyl-CoA hydratase